ncbi:hypothetical protein EDD86DRAFT_248278 [Gorgonomyces haynaldii]|nr:hypothetical protein EDD86DRAFT_248278 [Gorgonomyces haynaldii]
MDFQLESIAVVLSFFVFAQAFFEQVNWHQLLLTNERSCLRWLEIILKHPINPKPSWTKAFFIKFLDHHSPETVNHWLQVTDLLLKHDSNLQIFMKTGALRSILSLLKQEHLDIVLKSTKILKRLGSSGLVQDPGFQDCTRDQLIYFLTKINMKPERIEKVDRKPKNDKAVKKEPKMEKQVAQLVKREAQKVLSKMEKQVYIVKDKPKPVQVVIVEKPKEPVKPVKIMKPVKPVPIETKVEIVVDLVKKAEEITSELMPFLQILESDQEICDKMDALLGLKKYTTQKASDFTLVHCQSILSVVERLLEDDELGMEALHVIEHIATTPDRKLLLLNTAIFEKLVTILDGYHLLTALGSLL